MTTTLFYNAVMLVIDVVVLLRLRAKRTLVTAGALGVVAATTGFLVALLLAQDRFAAIRLADWAIFAHGVVLSLGTALVFWRSRRGWSLAAVAVAVGLLLIAADAFLIEPEWLEVSHVEIASAKLSRPCRIVVLADFQADRVGPYERRVIRSVVEAKPDIVLLAGDYLQAEPAQREQVRAELNTLLHEADLAVHARLFAVQGDMEGAGWANIFLGLNVKTVSATKTFDLGGGFRHMMP